jgi:hypothetical protein
MFREPWTLEKAWAWYKLQPWLVGANFTPSTAINQLEMWQKDTFDPLTIDRELSWAAALGMNCVRVYLHDMLHQADADGFKQRIDKYLQIAAWHNIRTVFVLFDDCWNQQPQLGKQPQPKPGVHNSGWVQSPGSECVVDPDTWESLESYVSDVVSTFADDRRVLFWDLYNEPGNNKLDEQSLPLLKKAFQWARQARPSQPLSVAVWYNNPLMNEYILSASDVITFHNYDDVAVLVEQIAELKTHDRPLICTEYMARPRGSLFVTHMPIFKQEGVGCINWGLVSGKTNTIFPWGSEEGTPEPEVWFHDILRADGTPFNEQEMEFIRSITGVENA